MYHLLLESQAPVDACLGTDEVADVIVLFEPCLDDDLSLFDCAEPLCIDNLPA